MANPMSKKAKLIAMYFPQLHEIPENNKWWGDGFTDWENVKSAQPQHEEHNQPRVPLNKNYYDQSKLDTLHWQVNLAKQYGIFGFCHYHYWFDGKQLLETPTNLAIKHKELNMPFCLSWANETWSKRWDGRDHHILIKQTHPPIKARWKLHFDYLIKAWTDHRSIKVNEMPIFAIYRPHRIPEIDNMLDYWRELSVKAGLKGLYFIAQKQYEFPNTACLKSFDAIFQFQPFESIYSSNFKKASIKNSTYFKLVRALPESLQDLLRSAVANFSKNKPTFHEYDQVWQAILNNPTSKKITTYPGAFIDWDNTARYKDRATIFKGATPEKFEYWFKKLVDSIPNRNLPEPLIFINAWNEWAESAYLEPDESNGFAYLEAVERVLINK